LKFVSSSLRETRLEILFPLKGLESAMDRRKKLKIPY
jgi:hypothetical protein